MERPFFAAPETRGPESPEPFLDWLFERAGLSSRSYRPAVLQRRLSACLRSLHVRSPDEARALLVAHPELLATALGSVLIGVTGFFREAPVFLVLRDLFLPRLLAEGRGVRVCSAGCSSGHELYSLAMLLAEAGALEQSELLGVDCRPEALAHAQAGVFEPAELETVPLEYRARYFENLRGFAAVRPGLRKRTRWEQADLLAAPLETGWDLLFCRNVSIYLECEAASRLWDRMVGLLRPGGLLVIGKAERPPPCVPLRRLSPCIYERPAPSPGSCGSEGVNVFQAGMPDLLK